MEPLEETVPFRSMEVSKCAPVDIEFQDLTYSVRDNDVKGGWRKLLKGVNGLFRSGELTAIMGPSGAGKSTLLNILAGYVSTGVKGTIKINDRPRDMKIFNKLLSYIMQDDILQPMLSVRESMMIASHLKLGYKFSYREKVAKIEGICRSLGLEKCIETRSEFLSGGQRKRLAIALELINNPLIIVLDEPTTGLDNFAMKQCLDLLHILSREGRTVICTIHQPPTSLFQSFDQVYVLGNGMCVYNGSPNELVPFLANSMLPCPQSNTPAEYIIELVQENPETIVTLSNFSQNGKANLKRKPTIAQETYIQHSTGIYQEKTQMRLSDMDVEYPVTLTTQFMILLRRMFVQMCRNKTTLYIQFFHHLCSALVTGGIFFGIGQDAARIASTFKFCISVTVFFMYTYVMTSIILFPLDVKLMKREYFNRWYSLKAYYLAVSAAGLPLLIILGAMFSIIVYIFSDQPMELERFVLFCVMCICVGLCSQGLGYSIGAVCNVLNGSVVGPLILTPLLALAVYGMGYRSAIEPYMTVLMSFSYVRFGLVGICNSIFNKRPVLECSDEVYCFYNNPEAIMIDMGMGGSTYRLQAIGVFIFTILFRILAYLALRYRVSAEFSTKIAHYAEKIVNMREH